jgi:hypothetical protein
MKGMVEADPSCVCSAKVTVMPKTALGLQLLYQCTL